MAPRPPLNVLRALIAIVLSPIALAAIVLSPGPAQADLANSKHNLSIRGPIEASSFGSSAMCIFCHTPHISRLAAPLWNRSVRSLLYTPYSSSTLKSSPGQPTSDSKLCLSCHDGTIAMGAQSGGYTGTSMLFDPSDRAMLSTDLSDDHPVSFDYDFALAARNPELISPAQLPDELMLDVNGQMQCTTCHNPHSDSYPKFLVMDHTFSALCISCHDKPGWTGSSHDISPSGWNGGGVDPWPHTEWTSVAANGCENCHSPHAAGSSEWLLNFYAEEDNCLSCHAGDVASTNIAAELRKPHRHPVEMFLGVHDPVEEFAAMRRHVECQDCHNPHATIEGQASPPYLSGPLSGVAGITTSGMRTERASYQYEVCYRCHSDNPDVPMPAIDRQLTEQNIRLKLDPSNPSFHPVVGPGQSTDVPSLIFPLTESSLIYCTDCHASDSGPGTGGGGPAGPHGSSWPFLLKYEYRVADKTSESPEAYALCYECHDRQSILDDSSFAEHSRHIEGRETNQPTPCSVCHDPHGVRSSGAGDHSHLINFDTSIVKGPDFDENTADDPTPPSFVDTGTRAGECYLWCHEKRHDPEEYP